MINDELEKLGLKDIKEIYHNISYDELFNHEIKNQEGRVSANGTFMVTPVYLPAEALKISILFAKTQARNLSRGEI